MSDPEEVMKRCRAGTTNHEAANALHADCYGTIGSLEAQMKELEEDLQRVCDQRNIAESVANSCIDGHHITEEQINAAWATRVGDGDFISASKLGIKRCGKCHGEGSTGPLAPNIINIDCPDCNVRGWVEKKK